MPFPIHRGLSSSQISDCMSSKKELSIPSRGPSVNNPWVRNKSWLKLPVIGPTDQKFVGLYAVFNDESNFISLKCEGDYTVDWGDGTTPENISSGVQANHQYSYTASGLADTNKPVSFTDAGDLMNRNNHNLINGDKVQFQNIVTTTGLNEFVDYYVINATANTFQVSITACGTAVPLTGNGSGDLLGYKQAIVSVTPNSGNLTSINLQVAHPQPKLQIYYNAYWLDITLGSPNLTYLEIAATDNVDMNLLEQVTIISHNLTNLDYLFNYCTVLQSVPLFDTSNVTSMESMFYSCFSLQNIPLFDTSNVTSMVGMFYSCYSLQNIPLFDTSNVTSMESMFYNCCSLQNIPLFDTSNVTSMKYMFLSCFSLQNIPLLNTSNVTSMKYMFLNCLSLQNIPLLNTSKVTSMYDTFQYCYGLHSIPLLDASLVTEFNFTFDSCSDLSVGAMSGVKTTISYNGCKLSNTNIELIFQNLANNTTDQTITVTNNWGNDTPIVKTATINISSNTLIMADTTGISPGMYAIGPYIPFFQDCTVSANTLTPSSGVAAPPNGLKIALNYNKVSTTTTIEYREYKYYVVNSNGVSFKVSDAPGGSFIPISSTDPVYYSASGVVLSVIPNTSVTLDCISPVHDTESISFSTLNTSIATIKNWSVVR